MHTTISQLKIYISTLLLAIAMIAAAGSASAVTGGDFGIGELPPGTEITIFGDGLGEKGQVVTVDKNRHFDAEIPCIPGASYHAEWVDENGKKHRGTSAYLCPEAATSSDIGWWIVGGIAATAGAYAVATQSDSSTPGTSTTPGTPVGPGPFTSCTVRITGNPDTAVSGGPTTFTGSPFTFFGTPGHILTLVFLAATDPTGGWSIAASGPGVCSGSFSTAGTTFPLTGTGTSTCGISTMTIVNCI